MKSSLRAILLGLTSVAIITVTVGGLAVNLLERSGAQRVRLAEQSRRLAAAGAPLLLDSLVVGDLARAEQTLRNLNADTVWSEVTLYESDGRRIILDVPSQHRRSSAAPWWLKRLLSVRLEAHRVPIVAEPVVYGILVVTPSVENLEGQIWRDTRAMILVTGVLLVTLLALMHVILAWGLRPIRALGESAARLGSGDLTTRMPESRLAEMAPAVRAFNAMAASLEQALHEARTRQGRLEALLDVSSDLSRIQPLESLLGRIAETCGRLVNTDSAEFWLVEGDELVVAGTWGVGKDMLLKTRLKIGESLSGIVAATGRSLSVRDPADDPRLLTDDGEVMRRLGYRGFLGVPAKIGDRVVGVLSLYTRFEEGFSAEDMTIVGAFASHAAIGLENSRLLHEAQRAYKELTQTQDQLEQVQKMEAIGRLAGGVAHDFNNLLTVILGRTQLLLQPLKPQDPLRRGLELIEKTAGRAADLTRQLLAFSRKQVLEPVVLDLNTVTADLKEMLERLIGEDIALDTALAPALGSVKADRSQIEQVILNLVVNARDAMPQGGHLTLESANVNLDAGYVSRHAGARPGPHIMLSVSDTGCGMPPEVQAHIFEPFFTTKEQGKGTGLGMATAYGIVKQSGGYIEVYSEPGRGTAIKIYLPRVAEAPETVERGLTAGLPLKGTATILLVEDEEAVRELARDILEGHGYTVLEAGNGGEALLACERHQGSIPLLLTDVVMPQMSGPQLAERLLPLHPEMKVLYMSGYTDDAVIRHGMMDAGIAFIQKPFTPATLMRAVREMLDMPRRGLGRQQPLSIQFR